MERFVVRQSPSLEKPRRRVSPLLGRTTIELNGRFPPAYCLSVSQLLLDSYTEAKVFGHRYSMGSELCPTHLVRVENEANQEAQLPLKREGISGMEFDNKGIYLASVTKSGCITVHDYETLYCTAYGPSTSPLEDEAKLLFHVSAVQQLDVVRWNVINQDEVACASRRSNKILIFDIGYLSSEPVEALEKGRSKSSLNGSSVHCGLPDILFSKSDKFRMLASDSEGLIHIWDRRHGLLPHLVLTTNTKSQLNSIQLDIEERVVFGASKNGVIYAWDLRGGRTSFAFQCHNEVHHPLLTSVRIAALLEKIASLRAQTNIVAREIHSINFNPSCLYQLAFHLDDGWSGVLDTNDFSVTHMHCPPPPWLNGVEAADSSFLDARRPSWLPMCSIYAVPSHASNGIHLLDFYPDKRSRCHVNFNDDAAAIPTEESRDTHSKFVPLSESALVCTAHPLNSTIVVGTKQSSLVVISQDIRQISSE